jgi:hypothetical protein
MPIKLNGSSSGFTQIDAASVAGNNTLTLPTASGTLMTTGGTNTFTANQVIEVTDNTNAALRITQLGTGNALVVEDSTNPDSTPFVVDASGNVGVATSSPSYKLDANGQIRAYQDASAGSSVFIASNTSTANNTTKSAGISYQGRDTVGTVKEVANIWAYPVNSDWTASALGFWTRSGDVTSERMRIDSSGNVGIGASPSQRLDVFKGTVNSAIAQFTGNNSGRGLLISTAATTFADDTVKIDAQYATYGTMVLATGGTERMRISSSGNVGIGAAPAASQGRLQAINTGITGGTPAASGTTDANQIASLTAGSVQLRFGVTTPGDYWLQSSLASNFAVNTSLLLNPNGGNVLVGATTYTGAGVSIASPNGSGSYSIVSAGGTGFHWRFGNVTNGVVGGISTSTTATTYATSSDYRLKEDVQPVLNAAERLMTLNPVNFAWKSNGERVDGFIAHEVQEVIPEAVTGEKDAVDADGKPVYQGIDQSKLVPLLTAALQEALTKITALETRLATLESA